MNYFPMYPGDYQRDTNLLTLVQHGAYLKLLMTYYAEGRPLPAQLNELAVACGAVTRPEREAVWHVAERYFPKGRDGKRHNKRADEEIAKAAELMASVPERKSNQAMRQQRSRQRRKEQFDALRAVGVVLPFDTSSAELAARILSQNVTMSRDSHSDRGVTSRVTVTASHCDITRDITATRQEQELLGKTEPKARGHSGNSGGAQ